MSSSTSQAALFALVALTSLGCAQHAPSIPVQTASLPPPPASASGVAPTAAACATIAGANQQVFAKALAKRADPPNADGGTRSLDDYLPHPCLQSATTAWSVSLLDLDIDIGDESVFSASWELVHIARNGETARFHDKGSTFTAGTGAGPYGPKDFWSFDFDDDGDPEIVFTEHSEPAERVETNTKVAYRFDHGSIEAYDPVANWTDLQDLDHDGRPDAIVEHSVTDYGGCGSYESRDLNGPLLAAHSVRGGFSTTDQLAKSVALDGCAHPPNGIVALAADHTVDEHATATNVICARVWGAPAATVVHAIEAGCSAMNCADEVERPTRPGECFHLTTLISWAKQAPIVSLANTAK